MEPRRVQHKVLRPAVLAVVGSTAMLTAAFIGLAAAVSGELRPGIISRLPFYVLAFSVVFLLALWKLDDRTRDGFTVLVASSGMGLVAGILVTLAGEGAYFTVSDPALVVEQVALLFLSAAIICTGLGFWVIRHWREFATIGIPQSEDGANEMEQL